MIPRVLDAFWLTGAMSEEFHDRNLSESEFWGVDLTRTRFRDTDLSGSEFFHTHWRGVTIDGVVDKLVVNGVDVTDFVNAHDPWYPVRTQLEPTTNAELRHVWQTLQSEWSALIRRMLDLPAEVVQSSIDGEWSARDTLRHLVFVIDKWFMWPVLGAREFSAIGLPNTGSQALNWPGVDLDADPSFEDVLAVRSEKIACFTGYIEAASVGDLPGTVEVLENGTVPAIMCVHAVLEEEFEHLRYTIRDLDILTA